MVDFESAQPGEDYSEARAMTIHNLKFIGWAMHNFTKRRCQQDGRPEWREDFTETACRTLRSGFSRRASSARRRAQSVFRSDRRAPEALSHPA